MIALYQWDPSESSLRNSPLGNKNIFFMLLRGEKFFQQTSNPGEALSTFIRASRDPKGETQLRVAKSTKMGTLTPKTKPTHFLNNSKTTLKKSRNRLF